MKPVITILLISHVTLGTIALLTGLIPMFAPKGGRLHNRTGRVYVWSMTYVAVSAALLCLLQPFTLFRLFLAGVALFSFYLSTTGWRAATRKTEEAGTLDRGLTYTTLLASLGMLGFGLLLFSRSAFFMGILFSFFGVLTFVFAGQDFRRFSRNPADPRQARADAWFFKHLTRMGGSYIAAFSAFLVNNAQMLPPGTPEWVHLASWMAPTAVGGVLINRTVAFYRKKFYRTPRRVYAGV